MLALFERWVAQLGAENPMVINVERDPDVDRWYVRVRGEAKLVTTVWFTVREETVHYETYFMPAPEEQVEACLTYLLRANQRFYGMRFAIGGEDAIYLVGQLPFSAFAADFGLGELDRILGSAFAYSEECFPTAMAIGFGSRFRPHRPD